MDFLIQFMDQHLAGPMNKLAAQKHLRAVRDGIVATLPLIIVGSFFMIVANPPLPLSWGITQFLKDNAAQIVLPYRMTMALMTLYSVFGIGYSLAQSYEMDALTGGILAEAAFLLTFTPINVAADLEAGVSGFVLPVANLGGGGMFVGIVTAILAVEIARLILNSNFKITMPKEVPPSVARSFEALTPAAVIVVLMGTVTYYLGFNWHAFIGNLVAPLIKASDSLPSVLLQVFLITFFWAFGIHGVSVVGSAARPIWNVLLDKNVAAAAAGTAGTALPAIAVEPFFQWFIWIGGSGATIGLAICMAFFAKSSYAKSLGKTAFVPALFNINEPLIFGTPIVLNPTLIIPFILAPMINATIAWVATSMRLVDRLTIISPWTLPGPIGVYLASAGDWRTAVLNIVLIVLSVMIYFPFFKMYDRSLVKQETGE
ncbi:PTS lactose transporter subunit IIC [Erysipelothrix larvae]|uniref:Permease IIC component n=1 Tax=Erysipelothrix larvae TaxID=1514105 RepID=A0A0X8H153_9FIRM|nr:PTS transporter subunit EIIC [Erysipelothrix larvae]AMC93944.1 PTS lactose transporter subunit IIC [Erysipelothrix larvae]